MIGDKNLLFSDQQDFAAATAGTYYSSKCLDLWNGNTAMPAMPNPGGTPISDIGRGAPVEVLAQVTESFVTNSTGGTMKVALVSSTAANLCAGTNIVVHAETEVIAAATMVAGYQFKIRCIPSGITQRYLGLRYTTATDTLDAGKVQATILLDRQDTPNA